MAILSIIFSIIGFAALSFAMERHFDDFFGRGKSDLFEKIKIPARIFGGLCLFISLIFCIIYKNPSMGFVMWLGVLTLGALIQAFSATYIFQKK